MTPSGGGGMDEVLGADWSWEELKDLFIGWGLVVALSTDEGDGVNISPRGRDVFITLGLILANEGDAEPVRLATYITARRSGA
jgi:hypothetical protein